MKLYFVHMATWNNFKQWNDVIVAEDENDAKSKVRKIHPQGEIREVRLIELDDYEITITMK